MYCPPNMRSWWCLDHHYTGTPFVASLQFVNSWLWGEPEVGLRFWFAPQLNTGTGDICSMSPGYKIIIRTPERHIYYRPLRDMSPISSRRSSTPCRFSRNVGNALTNYVRDVQ